MQWLMIILNNSILIFFSKQQIYIILTSDRNLIIKCNILIKKNFFSICSTCNSYQIIQVHDIHYRMVIGNKSILQKQSVLWRYLEQLCDRQWLIAAEKYRKSFDRKCMLFTNNYMLLNQLFPRVVFKNILSFITDSLKIILYSKYFFCSFND